MDRSYETREGEKRTVVELQVEEVAPSLKYATAQVTRSQRGSTSSGGQQRGGYGGGQDPAGGDWGSGGGISGGGFPGAPDEPPFAR